MEQRLSNVRNRGRSDLRKNPHDRCHSRSSGPRKLTFDLSLNNPPAGMDPSFATPGLLGEVPVHEHGSDTKLEDFPEAIQEEILLGKEAPFSHRQVCKKLRSLYDESCTQLRILDQGYRYSRDLSAAAHGEPCIAAGNVLQHSDLLSLLKRLPRLDTLLDLDMCRGQVLPWEKMGQILGGQLTRLVCHFTWPQLRIVELFPSLRRLEVHRNILMRSQSTLELPPLSALQDLQHLELHCLHVDGLDTLSACSQLQYLDLGGCHIEELGPLMGCSQLQFLSLCGCPIKDLGPLVQCAELQSLKLAGMNFLRDLGPLTACVSLQLLDLSFCSSVSDLKPLALCANLLYLNLSYSPASDFECLASCTGLLHLNLSRCERLHSLAPVASCHKLQRLSIFLNMIPSLEPLWGLQELQDLDLRGTCRGEGLDLDLGPLTRVKQLLLKF